MFNSVPDKKTPKIKKVAPYPIKLDLSKDGVPTPLKGNIVRLTELGFLAKFTAEQFFQIGEVFSTLFDLPVVNASINIKATVVKTYFMMEPQGDTQVKTLIVEMHFLPLSRLQITAIDNYLIKSGQKRI